MFKICKCRDGCAAGSEIEERMGSKYIMFVNFVEIDRLASIER